MKKVLYLGIVLMLASCGSSTLNVDGREVSTIKIGNLEVMTEDLEGEMEWDDAMKACADLGDGWRLPTKDELNTLYQNKDKIGGFANSVFWSSTEYSTTRAYSFYFFNGYAPNCYKFTTRSVRAVRAF